MYFLKLIPVDTRKLEVQENKLFSVLFHDVMFLAFIMVIYLSAQFNSKMKLNMQETFKQLTSA